MKKFFASTILTALLAWCAFLFADITPWWIFAFGAFISGLFIVQHGFFSFLSAFLGAGLVWALLMYGMDASNGQVLSRKMAQVLPLHGSSFLIILISAAVGGLTAGLASATGTLLRKASR